MQNFQTVDRLIDLGSTDEHLLEPLPAIYALVSQLRLSSVLIETEPYSRIDSHTHVVTHMFPERGKDFGFLGLRIYYFLPGLGIGLVHGSLNGLIIGIHRNSDKLTALLCGYFNIPNVEIFNQSINPFLDQFL